MIALTDGSATRHDRDIRSLQHGTRNGTQFGQIVTSQPAFNHFSTPYVDERGNPVRHTVGQAIGYTRCTARRDKLGSGAEYSHARLAPYADRRTIRRRRAKQMPRTKTNASRDKALAGSEIRSSGTHMPPRSIAFHDCCPIFAEADMFLHNHAIGTRWQGRTSKDAHTLSGPDCARPWLSGKGGTYDAQGRRRE